MAIYRNSGEAEEQLRICEDENLGKIDVIYEDGIEQWLLNDEPLFYFTDDKETIMQMYGGEYKEQ